MNSGCICCTLVGDFEKALGDVLSQYAPDRIIIEPSGVGKLSDVAAAVQPVLREGEVEMGVWMRHSSWFVSTAAKTPASSPHRGTS